MMPVMIVMSDYSGCLRQRTQNVLIPGGGPLLGMD